MSLEQKNKPWRPNAEIAELKHRADLLRKIRDFFSEREVFEVETPLMCRTASLDPFIQPIPALYSSLAAEAGRMFYLQSSPEFAMKRLLAAGSGPIYQICKAFRNAEEGRLHNPEFTMLEWYRPGFDHHALMDEMEALLAVVLGSSKTDRFTYQALFLEYLGVDPLQTSLQQLSLCAAEQGVHLEAQVQAELSLDDWLDLLMTHCIEPKLGFDQPVMIYDYPASKAALAKIRPTEPPVAERFEVYVNGIELANGFHELMDPAIQLARFNKDCEFRKQLGYPAIPIDDYFLAALEFGLPASAGVALGIDRLVMLALGKSEIQAVVSFTIDRV